MGGGEGGGGGLDKNEILSYVGGGGLVRVSSRHPVFFLLKKIGFAL